MNKSPYSIALLTPYCGSNLGDGAIQISVIEQLKARLPSADIIGITLHPQDTQQRHHIRSHLISAATVPYYTPVKPDNAACNHSAPQLAKSSLNYGGATHVDNTYSSFESIKRLIKKVPFVFNAIKTLTFVSGNIRADILHWFDSYFLLRKVDMLVVSGGGQFDEEWGGPWGHPYALFKWSVLAKLTRTPLIILSVGACQLENRLSQFFIGTALKIARYVSVRDSVSLKRITAMFNGTAKKVRLVPDLAFNYPVSNYSPVRFNNANHKIVGISPIAYLNPEYWPNKNSGIYDHYTRQLSIFVSHLLRQNYHVVIFCTTNTDKRVIDVLLHNLATDVKQLAEQRIEQPPIASVNDLISVLKALDYLIASRLHGLLLSFVTSCPSVAISYDLKVDTLMADLEQESCLLNIHNFDAEALKTAFSRLIDNESQIKQLIHAKITTYQADIDRQYDIAFFPR